MHGKTKEESNSTSMLKILISARLRCAHARQVMITWYLNAYYRVCDFVYVELLRSKSLPLKWCFQLKFRFYTGRFCANSANNFQFNINWVALSIWEFCAWHAGGRRFDPDRVHHSFHYPETIQADRAEMRAVGTYFAIGVRHKVWRRR
jgi:hypothetical protein